MDKTVVAVVALIAFAISGLVGSITVYNLRTNAIYADLLKNAKDPLAVRCAWGGDQQVCQIVGLKH